MSVVKINGKPYKFTEHENELIKKNGLTPGMVAKRVRGGWALLEALNAPYGMRLAEYKDCLLYTSPSPRASAHLVCRLLLEKIRLLMIAAI
ncbi:hypothetical protein JMUB7522_27080 [Staphylococcus aureus]